MKITALALFVFLPFHWSAASTSILDVFSPHGGTKATFISFGQTFTPQSTGTLDKLRLMIASSAPSFTVTIWEFDPESGQLGQSLGSQSLVSSRVASSYSWAEVSFANPIQQEAGVPLAFTISGNSNFSGPAISDSSVYSGGAFFEYSGSPSLMLLNRDLAFETYITSVPEPASCVIAMLASMGILCRRRPVKRACGVLCGKIG